MGKGRDLKALRNVGAVSTGWVSSSLKINNDIQSIVAETLAEIWNIPQERALEIYNHFLEYPLVLLVEDIEGILFGTNDIDYQTFKKDLDAGIAWIEKLKEYNPPQIEIDDLAKILYSHGSGIAASKRAGIRETDMAGYKEIQYLQVLSDDAIASTHIINLDTLVQSIFSIREQTNSALAKIYCQDIISASIPSEITKRTEVAKEIVTSVSRSSKDIELLILLSQEYLRLNSGFQEDGKISASESVREIYALLGLEAHGFLRVIEAFEPHRQKVLRQYSQILGFFHPDEQWEAFDYLSSNMGDQALSDSCNSLCDLLRKIPEDTRLNLLEYFSENPFLIGLYGRIKTAVQARKFLDFAVYTSGSKVHFDGSRTFFELVEEVSRSNVCAAGVVLDQGLDYLSDEHAQEIFELAVKNKNAHLLIRYYFEAKSAGEINKAYLYLGCADILSDNSQLKSFHRELTAFDGDITLETLERILDLSTMNSLLKSIPKRAQQPAMQKSEEPSRYEILMNSIDGSIPTRDKETIGRAYAGLEGSSLEPRFWRIAREGTNQLVNFSKAMESDIADMLYIVLSEPKLFAAYLTRLNTGGDCIHNDLGEAMHSTNPYKQIRDLFLAKETKTDAHESPAMAASRITEGLNFAQATRILIFGGLYYGQNLERVIHALDGLKEPPTGRPDILVYPVQSISKRDREFSFRDGDNLIIVFSINTHTITTALRKHSGGLPINYYPFPGSTGIVDYLRANYHPELL